MANDLPSAADLSGVLDLLQNLNQSGTTDLNNFVNKVSDAKDIVADFKDVISGGVKTLGDFKKSLAGLGDSIDGIKKLKHDLLEVKETIFGAEQNLTSFIAKGLLLSPIGTKLLPIAEAFNKIGSSADASNQSLDQMISTAGRLFNIDSNNSILQHLTELGKRSDTAKNFEAGVISLAARSGELGDLLENIGDDYTGLSLKTEKFSDMIYQLGNASGLSSTQVAEYAKQLMLIPGALDTSVEAGEDSGKTVQLLDAAMKIAAGTGMDFKDVVDDLNTIFRNFGQTGEEPLQIISRMSAASQNLRMPLDLVKSYVNGTSNSFKMFGQNAQGAINILERFTPALAESGAGPEMIRDLVSGVTDGIKSMGISQKAFLSAQTGGPKGLQGAYQIDLALKQGKVDDVYQKVEQNLRKQFGGRIVTLEQAAQDQKAAGQFTKQVQMLQSSAFGSIAKSDAEAYRLLDVFAKGTKPSTERTGIKSPEESFKDAFVVGDKLQERQYNVLTQINNISERSAQLQAIIAFNTSRKFLGAEGGLQDYVRSVRERNEINVGQDKLITGLGPELGKNADQTIQEALGNIKGNAFEAQDKLKNILPEFINQMFDNTTNQQPNQPKTFLPPKTKLPELIGPGVGTIPVNNTNSGITDVNININTGDQIRQIAMQVAGKVVSVSDKSKEEGRFIGFQR